MLKGIDISNYQGHAGMKISHVLDEIDFCICKATEATGFVDGFCDVFVQTLRAAGKPWGFYHFAGDGEPQLEADYFVANTLSYFGEGVPVLDWEGNQSVEWVNAFVSRVHETTGVWPWIYANPWRFSQGDVETNCMRWVASYPDVESPTFDQAASWDCPKVDGIVGAWQFCSDGKLEGYSGNLDFDLYYGDERSWNLYAGRNSDDDADNGNDAPIDVAVESILENGEYKVTIERKLQ